MKAIAHERRRSGYRRIHGLLKGGYVIKPQKALFRLYGEEKLDAREKYGLPASVLCSCDFQSGAIPRAPNGCRTNAWSGSTDWRANRAVFGAGIDHCAYVRREQILLLRNKKRHNKSLDTTVAVFLNVLRFGLLK
jgi:hypothetical protein